MKITIKSILMFSLLINSYAQNTGQWEILNYGANGTIDFVTENIGWLADADELFKTIDQGETWFLVPTEGYHDVQYADFLNETIGWIIGDWKIYKTVDGGYSWELQFEHEHGIRSLQVVNDSTLVCGEGLGVYKTIDGGKNWSDFSSPIFEGYWLDDIIFMDNNTGFVVGFSWDAERSDIFRTLDGGDNWYILNNSEYKYLFDLHFVNDSTAYTIARDYIDNDYVLESKDTCSSWTIITKITEKGSYIDNIRFFNDNTAYAIIADTLSRYLMQSFDKGAVWEALDLNGWEAHDLYFEQNNFGFVQARNAGASALFRVSDGGETRENLFFSYPFNDVFFVNNQWGFSSGCHSGSFRGHGEYRGTIWYTKDGGENWLPQWHGNLINNILFANDLVGFFVNWWTGREISDLYRTIDGGESWEVQPTNGYIWNLNDLCITANHTIWAAGSYQDTVSEGPAIFITHDSGENWQVAWLTSRENINHPFNSIHFHDLFGYAVGDSGLVLKYTSEDSFNVLNVNSDLSFNKVFFSDEKHGWISGGYLNNQGFNSIILKTINAGQTWSEKRFDKYLINDMFFEDSLHGWGIGTDTSYYGIVIETIDGGENWTVQVEGLIAPLNAIHFKDGYGWAVGGNGLVLRTDNGVNWIDQTGKIYPDKHHLYQNYPNPFNNSTMINYQLPVGANHYSPVRVELSIYSILGQKVATLVDKKQLAGNYKVEWDASGFASGIYIYQLTAKGQKQSTMLTKKLVLLK